MSEKPRTAEQARISFRQIIRELPEEERGRLIYFAGIADRPDAAEDSIGFLKEMLAKLPDLKAEDGIAFFKSIYNALPQDQRDRLSFLAVAFGEDFEPIHFFAGVLQFIMGVPEQFRCELLVMTIEAMSLAERRRWIRYCERPGVFGNIEARNILLSALRHVADAHARDTQADRAFRDALCPFSPAVKARIALVGDRVETIDDLLNEGYLRSEIYEQMRIKHGKLIPGRGKDEQGNDKEIMDEDSMWESYFEGGGCHQKAIRPRGRPRKNGRNCNNGKSSKK
jgi:hypothetical protein